MRESWARSSRMSEKIAAVFGELFGIGATGVGVVVGGAEVVAVNAFEDAEDHVGRSGELAVGCEFVEGTVAESPGRRTRGLRRECH
jgi:hypothetical protein